MNGTCRHCGHMITREDTPRSSWVHVRHGMPWARSCDLHAEPEDLNGARCLTVGHEDTAAARFVSGRPYCAPCAEHWMLELSR